MDLTQTPDPKLGSIAQIYGFRLNSYFLGLRLTQHQESARFS